MTDLFKINLCFLAAIFVSSCSQVLQSVDLQMSAVDNSSQETFSVIEKTLTIKEARKQKDALYVRTVLQNGRGGSAQPIPESVALISRLPNSKGPAEYKIGIGILLHLLDLLKIIDHPSKKQTNGQ